MCIRDSADGGAQLEEVWKTIKEAVDDVTGERQRNGSGDWFDGEYMEIIHKKNEARQRMTKRNTRNNAEL